MTDLEAKITDEMKSYLVDQARDARGKAYAPYSDYPVGAAVMANGQVFRGANIEIGGRMGSIHAEMVALYKAVYEGHTRVDAVASSTTDYEPYAMCGLCQHVISEFADDAIILCDVGDEIAEYSLSDERGDAWKPGDSR